MPKLTPVVLLTFVNVIGFSILIPVLPEVIELYYSGSYAGIIYGGLLSSYAFMQFLAAPFLGILSDKYGRRPLLIASQAGTLLSWCIFSAAYFLSTETMVLGAPAALVVLAISRAVDGITGGNMSVAQAYVVDVTPAEQRTKAFGIIGVAYGLGILVGPVIGGFSVTTSVGYLGTAIVAGAISIITLLAIALFLPESLRKQDRAQRIGKRLRGNINIFHKFSLFDKKPFYKNLLKIRTVFALILAAYTTILSLILVEMYHLDAAAIGMILGIVGLLVIANQLTLVTNAAKYFGDLRTFFIGLFLTSFGFALFVPLPYIISASSYLVGIGAFIAITYLINLGVSLSLITFKSVISLQVASGERGQIVGIDDSLFSFGQGISPIIAGVLFAGFDMWIFGVFAAVLYLPAIWIYQHNYTVITA